MLLRFPNGTPFATGAVPYSFRPATDLEKYPRIQIKIGLGELASTAFIDTGGFFLLCSPMIAEYLGLDARDALAREKILWRGTTLTGTLHRVALNFGAQVGEDLLTEVTAFVPRLAGQQVWRGELPVVLGMHGCMEFVRFAIDPSTDMFYFGGLDTNS
jgi:hypothetical protein